MCDEASLFSSVVSLLERWQTMVTGLLALGAAWWTITVIREQIALQRTEMNAHEARLQDAQRSKLFSVRAHMPDALSEITTYARRCMSYLHGGETTLPTQPSEAMNKIKDAIEYVDGETSASLFELISHYQVYNSRIVSYSIDKTKYDFSEKMYDTALLHALVDRMYDYARGEIEYVKSGKPSKKEMISSLRQAVGLAEYLSNEGDFEVLIKTIDRRHS